MLVIKSKQYKRIYKKKTYTPLPPLPITTPTVKGSLSICPKFGIHNAQIDTTSPFKNTMENVIHFIMSWTSFHVRNI